MIKVGSPHCGSMRFLERVSRRRGSVIGGELGVGVVSFKGSMASSMILSLDKNIHKL